MTCTQMSHDVGTLGIREFDRSLPMALMRARESVMRRFRPLLSEHGLTEQQWRVLRALADADRPVSVGELADATNLLGPSLSRMLSALVDRSLIERTPSEADGRRADIAITSAGIALLAQIAPRSEAEYAAIEEFLGPGELEALYATLARVAGIDAP